MEVKNLADLVKGGYGADGKDFISGLTTGVKRRVQALKKLQVEGIRIESQFYRRVHELEMEFSPLFDTINIKRRAIVAGEHEPSEEEANYPILHGFTNEELNSDDAVGAEGEEAKGIPGFWLHLLKNVAHINDMIQECDEPILLNLIDITCEICTNPDSYTLTFHFQPNGYFKQTQLKKNYILEISPDNDDIFDYDGPVVVKATGTKIDWYEGKDVTVKLIRKKQKRGNGSGRFITKAVKADSFFNFFEPPVLKENDESTEERDDEEQELLQADFEIGQLLRDQVVPRAVLFYTGENTGENDFFDDYDDMDEDEEAELDDDSDKE